MKTPVLESLFNKVENKKEGNQAKLDKARKL